MRQCSALGPSAAPVALLREAQQHQVDYGLSTPGQPVLGDTYECLACLPCPFSVARAVRELSILGHAQLVECFSGALA
eukprot:6199077-Pleurochrysis_carterae.AAC.2